MSEPILSTIRSLKEETLRADEPLDETESEDAEEAAADLATAQAELAKPEPRKAKVLRNLEKAKVVLSAGADVAEAGEKVGGYLIKLAPIAATLYQLAQKLLG